MPVGRVPTFTDDLDWAARLPLSLAQAWLTEGRAASVLETGSCGWHGQRFDADRGLFAIVDRDGPFADYYGSALIVTGADTRGTRQVVVYAHGLGDLFEDISLSRRAFLELAPLTTDALLVSVEVLA